MIQGAVSQGLTKPWDIDSVNKMIVLPSNIDQLVQQNYLVRLFVLALASQEYQIYIGTLEWVSRLNLTAENNYFLQAFGLTITNRDYSLKVPTNKGIVWKGVASGLKTILQSISGLDLSLFKIAKAPGIVEYLLGDTWTNYPVEKKMLDHMIHYTRTLPGFPCKIADILLPPERIISDKGLDFSVKGDLVSTIEGSFLKEVARIYYGVQTENITLDTHSIETLSDLTMLQNGITNRQKTISKPKTLLKETISKRVASCFEPYKGAARKKATKRPIVTLAAELKGTDDYSSFNPTVWLALIQGQSALPNKGFPDSEMLEYHISNVIFQLKDQMGETIISSLTSEYRQYLRDLKG